MTAKNERVPGTLDPNLEEWAFAAWGRGYRESIDKGEEARFGPLVSLAKGGIWHRNVYIGKELVACLEYSEDFGCWLFRLLGGDELHFAGTGEDRYGLAGMIRAYDAEWDERRRRQRMAASMHYLYREEDWVEPGDASA